MSRKTFQRLAEDDRRKELIEATLAVIADHGLHAASTRKIAEKAGVSAGLIRHHFESKDDMVRASYGYLVGMLTGRAAHEADSQLGDPEAGLAAFIAGNLSHPNLSSFKVSLWGTFIGVVRSDPEFAAIHRESYREFLEILERLIQPVLKKNGAPADDAKIRELAISVNGLIDGLWLEGSLGHDLYDPKILSRIGVESAEKLLALTPDTLLNHLPEMS